MNFLREAVSDGKTGKASSKRIAMLVATCALAVAVVILSVAAIYGRDIAMALGSVAVPLASLGGATYVGGKIAERSRAQVKPEEKDTP